MNLKETLDAIKKHNLIFVSSQPDSIYFHWQVEIYLYQFSKQHILDQCYAIFGYAGDNPSPKGLELAKKFPNRIHFYKDDRTSDEKTYIPSIRPHILKKFFQQYPHLGKNVFYHDSDIFLVRLPKFELLLKHNHLSYVSNTISYIGYNYLQDCSKRYKEKYPELEENDLIKKMVSLFGLSEEFIKENNEISGGAQYLLKGVDSTFWSDVENYSNKLYKLFKDYEKTYPIMHHVQSWATDMWAVLWCYWKQKKRTIVHTELDFSWATSSPAEYYKNPIFHLAGITSANSNTHFYKGAFTNKNVLVEYANNKNLFDHVLPSNATYEYVQVIKEYVDKENPAEYLKKTEISLVKRFLLENKNKDTYSDIYMKDEKSIYFMKPLWRSINGNFILFFNNSSWTLTGSQYEKEISETCGGFLSGTGDDEPYKCVWNTEGISCKIL